MESSTGKSPVPTLTTGVITLLIVSLIGFLFSVAYFDSIRVLLVLWLGLDEVSDHSGLLALACSVYLLLLKRERFRSLIPQPNPWAAVPLLLLSLLWYVAIAIDLQSAHLALLPVIMLCAVAMLLGGKFLRLCFFPILILMFVIPIWWPLLPYLRILTTLMTEVLLQLIGRPVFVDGFVLHLPGGSFLIDESCAGLRFLLVTMLLSCVCKDMFSMPLSRWIILGTIGSGLALAANWIRVVIIVMIGDATNMQSELVTDHANLGWIIYGIVVLLPFLVLNHFLSGKGEFRTQLNQGLMAADSREGYSLVISGVATALILLVGPLLAALQNGAGSGDFIRVSAPPGIPPVTLLNPELGAGQLGWRPAFVNADYYLDSRYLIGEDIVDLHLARYANQSQGSEVINVVNSFSGEMGWTERDSAVIELSLGEDKIQFATVTVANRTGDARLVWYWYRVGGVRAVTPISAKLLEITGLVAGRHDAALITLSTACEASCAEAEGVLLKFVSTMEQSLELLL